MQLDNFIFSNNFQLFGFQIFAIWTKIFSKYFDNYKI